MAGGTIFAFWICFIQMKADQALAVAVLHLCSGGVGVGGAAPASDNGVGSPLPPFSSSHIHA